MEAAATPLRGHYERFTSAELTRDHKLDHGAIYESIHLQRAAAAITWARPCK